MTSQATRPSNPPTRQFLLGLARAFGGAVIFSLPMLMTMELWEFGFVADRLRIALLLVLTLPVLVGLSHYCGFEPTFDWKDDLVDAFVACAVAFLTALLVLALFGEISRETPLDEAVAKIVLQSAGAAIGAVLAEGQFGVKDEHAEEEMENSSHAGELFLMLAGALFLALNIAPTDEVLLVACQMHPFQGAALAVLSLLIMHAFVYAVGFRGQAEMPEGATHGTLLLRFTVPGYAIALLASLYLLWTFGRLDGVGLQPLTMAAVVLGFPASIGAAGARLII